MKYIYQSYKMLQEYILYIHTYARRDDWNTHNAGLESNKVKLNTVWYYKLFQSPWNSGNKQTSHANCRSTGQSLKPGSNPMWMFVNPHDNIFIRHPHNTYHTAHIKRFKCGLYVQRNCVHLLSIKINFLCFVWLFVDEHSVDFFPLSRPLRINYNRYNNHGCFLL